MGIVSVPRRSAAIADDVATRGGGDEPLTAMGGFHLAYMIDSRQASGGARRHQRRSARGGVRQSRIYNLASLMLIMWGGAASFAGYRRQRICRRAMAGIGLDRASMSAGIRGLRSRISAVRTMPQPGVRTFDVPDVRVGVPACSFAFGVFAARAWLGHFTPRQLGTFWPIYFMMVYTHRRSVARSGVRRDRPFASPR